MRLACYRRIICVGFTANKTFLWEYFFVAYEALRKCISRHIMVSAVRQTDTCHQSTASQFASRSKRGISIVHLIEVAGDEMD